MIQNSLAALGFSLLLYSDFLWVKGRKGAPALRRAGYLLVFGGIGLWAFSTPSAVDLGSLPGIAFIAVAAASSALLLWSVFFEIGIERKKRGLGAADVIQSGSYDLCRHPGFWWFAFLISDLGLLKGFFDHFLTVLIMIGLDLLLIIVQDSYTFPKVFKGYNDYKKRVPFLIPRFWKA
ncbi:MAG: hypothetical protein Q8O15_05650 [Rectinemataceae bacterium]|nr:hypothetical protein [Rectinemataceae bacterium]